MWPIIDCSKWSTQLNTKNQSSNCKRQDLVYDGTVAIYFQQFYKPYRWLSVNILICPIIGSVANNGAQVHKNALKQKPWIQIRSNFTATVKNYEKVFQLRVLINTSFVFMVTELHFSKGNSELMCSPRKRFYLPPWS